ARHCWAESSRHLTGDMEDGRWEVGDGTLPNMEDGRRNNNDVWRAHALRLRYFEAKAMRSEHNSNPPTAYRGRLAPSPTGLLHLGHARTFWAAQERARSGGGALILRNEDLDRDRCKAEFVQAMFEDLRWFGFEWVEGPDCGGPFGPYSQSDRQLVYQEAFE